MESQVITDMHTELSRLGIIDNLLTPYELAYLDQFDAKEEASDSELLSLAMQSKSCLRKESAFELYTPSPLEGVDPWVENQVTELARIYIPTGQLGVLTRIDTLIVDATTGTPLNEWDNPQTWDDVFRFAVVYNKGASINAVRYVSPSVDPFPTTSFESMIGATLMWPIGIWNDNRYAWGNPSNEVGILLPKNTTVRLVAICKKNSIHAHSLKGRFTYTTQLEASISAAWRARRGNIR